ncbi:MAG: ATPase domain-containing protein [Bdellovibrionota bacterium]
MSNSETKRKTPSSARVKTGIEGLDDILCGGFPPHRIYLIDGDPGCGKTTLGLDFLFEGIKNGEKVLYITLSETKVELEAVADSHGWSLDGIEIFELQNSDFKRTEDENTFFHPSELELGETTRAILEQVERVNPSRVVFDSLSELRLLARDSLRYRRQILSLKQYFSGRDVTVLLLDDRTVAAGDLDLHSIVHGVIRLEQLAPEYGSDRRRLRVLKLRGVGFRGGFHDFRLQKGGIEIFPRLSVASDGGIKEFGMLSTGIDGLNKLLGGGLDRGASTLMMGPAGAGKSSLTISCALEACKNGEKASIFAFDESRHSINKRMSGLGYDVEKYVKNGLLSIKSIDPAELSPGEFVSLVRKSVEEFGSSVVIIDSLNGYLNAMPEERFLVIQLHELLSYLAQLGVTTFLVVAQHGLLGSQMETPVDITYLADTVVLLRYFEAFSEVRKAISVVKRRGGAHEKSIREFSMNPQGFVVGAPLTNFHGILGGIPNFTKEIET